MLGLGENQSWMTSRSEMSTPFHFGTAWDLAYGSPGLLGHAKLPEGDAMVAKMIALLLSRERAQSAAAVGLLGVLADQHIELKASLGPQTVVPHRARELAWRRNNEGALARFAGQWVVLEGSEIVAHGQDPTQLVIEARAKGIRVPYVFFVEPRNDDVVRIGL